MRSPVLLSLLLTSAPLCAQEMPGMEYHHAPAPAQAQPKPQPAAAATQHNHAAMQGHAMPGMDHTMAGPMMKGALGAYGMTRDASGTAWQPDSSPMLAIMGSLGGWSTMVHGFATLIHDSQGGPRGDRKTFSTSTLMGMVQRPVGTGTLTLRARGSLDAAMGHHWLDSTHVTFGVATAGVVVGGVKLEGSLFTGREPDERRWDIERSRMDSWSLRATWNPSADWSMQVSHGRLKSPEQLHPEEDVIRTTASVTHNRAWAGGNWQSTFAWGRNVAKGGDHGGATDAFLLDSAVQAGRNTLFGLGEVAEKDELFANDPANPLHDRVFTVGKLSVGRYHSVPIGQLALDLGGLASIYALPDALEPVYGTPRSAMLFARVRVIGR